MNILKNVDANYAKLIIQSPSIFICAEPVDFRKSKDGLLELVMREHKLDPYKNIFVFTNEPRNKIKVLAWHNNGFVVLSKWLEKGHRFFNVTKKGKKTMVSATQEQLSWMIAGLDWVNMSAWGELEYKKI